MTKSRTGEQFKAYWWPIPQIRETSLSVTNDNFTSQICLILKRVRMGMIMLLGLWSMHFVADRIERDNLSFRIELPELLIDLNSILDKESLQSIHSWTDWMIQEYRWLVCCIFHRYACIAHQIGALVTNGLLLLSESLYSIAGFFRGWKLSRISRFCGDSWEFYLRNQQSVPDTATYWDIPHISSCQLLPCVNPLYR